MRFEVKYGPAYALGVVLLDAGERAQVEAGVMVSMPDRIEIETQAEWLVPQLRARSE